ncbi:MAG: hypothetical protein ACI8WY_003943 [Planctomycetota bacterium]|jgi:hypothetical protein
MIRITAVVLTLAACLAQVSSHVAFQGAGRGQADATPVSAPTAHGFFVAGPDFTGIIDEQGKTQWAAPRAGARDGWVLPDGNVVIAWSNEVLEFRYGSHDVVWRYGLQEPNQEIGTVQRLGNGLTLVTELGTSPRILEVDATGAVVTTVALQPETENAHMQTRMARKLADGTYRVPHLLAFAVKLYRADGTVIGTIATDLEELGGRDAENWPFTAIDLPNGNVLVGCTHGNKVVEFTPEGEVAWVLRNVEVGGIINDACGVQRLPNGNTVIASYNAKSGPRMFEVDRDKNIVWSYDGPNRAHHFQILTTNGQPLPGPLLR